MITVQMAEAAILESMPITGIETVSVTDAVGRVLASTVKAERDQPPFDRATMDGFAIDSHAASDNYRIIGTAAAGHPQQRLSNTGECIEIMTGAPLPQGADCVVPVENSIRDGQTIRFAESAVIQAGKYVHEQASDHAQGHLLLAANSHVGVAEMAVLVSSGLTSIDVYALPKVAIVASGDELVDVGASINDYQIRRSNDYALQALFKLRRLANSERLHVRDDAAEQERLLAELLQRYDALVLTGGVSMGRYDYIPGVLQRLGVELIFHKVSQRPGKPMWFGCSREGKPVFALPGNPVSTLICARRYVVPALQRMSGLQRVPAPMQAILDETIRLDTALTGFVPVVHAPEDRCHVIPKVINTSGDFSALAGSAGFVQLARELNHFSAGMRVPFYPW